MPPPPNLTTRSSRAVPANILKNPGLVGGATGSPGTFPTYMGNNGTLGSIVQTIVGFGVDASNRPYIDYNLAGTTNNTGAQFMWDQGTLYCAPSTTYTGSAWVSLQAGGYTTSGAALTTDIGFDWYTPAGGFISNAASANFTATATPALVTVTGTTASNAFFTNLYIKYTWTSGVSSVNITLRMAGGMMQQATAAMAAAWPGGSYTILGRRAPGGLLGAQPILPPPQRDYSTPAGPTIGDRLVLVQELPGQPVGPLQAGVQGPNVASPEQIGTLVTVQELSVQPVEFLQHRIFGLNVRSPVADTVLLRQELPGHPLPILGAGVQGPNVRPPVSDRLATVQELPAQPPPVVRTGVSGPNVCPPVVDTVLLRQEQPGHPPPTVAPGIQGPNVAALPQIGTTVLRQEQPGHPLPTTITGIQGPNVRPSTSDTVITRQEQPGHPLPQTQTGVQGPNVRSPIVDRVQTVGEVPGHPLPVVRVGVAGPNVRPPVSDTTRTVQELPAQPPPAVSAGVQGPNVRVPTTDSVLLRQKAPGHPASILRGDVLPPPVVAGSFVVPGILLGRQEQPGHPASQLLPGLPPVAPLPQPPMVAVRQQQPDHPPSTFLPGLPPTIQLSATTRQIVLRQQQPDHPPSVLQPGVYTQPIISPFTPTNTWVRVFQESPWHPTPLLRSNHEYTVTPPTPPTPPRPFSRGRSVYLLADLTPQLQGPTQTRVVSLVPDIQSTPTQVPQTRKIYLRPD